MGAALAQVGAELVLERYRPLRPLGAGGSGSVWLARDEQTGLDVALKIIAREGKAAQRAEREVAAASRLRHPGCLRAYDFGRDDGHVYIAYEYVPGKTFREALREGELTDGRAVKACAQVCDALAHAHAAGILHRDVKPSNVLLADGTRVSARLLDFGLAQMAEAETLTEHGDVPGTLAYISPERLAGEESTGAADVWAVGVMLWEALAGRHPFWQGSMLETARAIERGARPLSELRPDLPKRLLQLVDRALALEPRRRPSAEALAAGLRGVRKDAERSSRLALPQARQAATALLAGVFAAWTGSALPFYPHGWAAGLGVAVAALSLWRERAGLALALAVPILPLGNSSLGVAALYTAAAVVWLALSWEEPHSGLLAALGPLLAPLYAVALFPLATLGVRSPLRRAAAAAGAVGVAAVAAGLRHGQLPLIGGHAPLGIGVSGAGDPLDVAGSLVRAAAAHPGLLLGAGALAVASVAVPTVRARGRWGALALGALLLFPALAGASVAAIASLVLCAAIVSGCAALLPDR